MLGNPVILSLVIRVIVNSCSNKVHVQDEITLSMHSSPCMRALTVNLIEFGIESSERQSRACFSIWVIAVDGYDVEFHGGGNFFTGLPFVDWLIDKSRETNMTNAWPSPLHGAYSSFRKMHSNDIGENLS